MLFLCHARAYIRRVTDSRFLPAPLPAEAGHQHPKNAAREFPDPASRRYARHHDWPGALPYVPRRQAQWPGVCSSSRNREYIAPGDTGVGICIRPGGDYEAVSRGVFRHLFVAGASCGQIAEGQRESCPSPSIIPHPARFAPASPACRRERGLAASPPCLPS